MENSKIKDRISRILKAEKLTYSKFADILDIQASGVSHIISGRNKPSLDFLQKILTNFSNINAQWLITGEGEMYKIVKRQSQINFELGEVNKATNPPLQSEILKSQEVKNEDKIVQTVENKAKEIKKIIVFYSDNSFEEFMQK